MLRFAGLLVCFVMISGQAFSGTFDYFGRGYWERYTHFDGRDWVYRGGTWNKGLRLRIVIDEAELGYDLISTTVSTDTFGAAPWLERFNGDFSLTFDADGKISDWRISQGFVGILGWVSDPEGDSFYFDSYPNDYWYGHSLPGSWGVSPVPIPYTSMLLASALCAVAGLSRRVRTNRSNTSLNA